MTAGLTAPITATSCTAVSRGCQTRHPLPLLCPASATDPAAGRPEAGGGCSRPGADDRPPFLGLLGAPFGAGGAWPPGARCPSSREARVLSEPRV